MYLDDVFFFQQNDVIYRTAIYYGHFVLMGTLFLEIMVSTSQRDRTI